MIVLEGVAERWQLVEEPPPPIALLLFKPVKWQSLVEIPGFDVLPELTMAIGGPRSMGLPGRIQIAANDEAIPQQRAHGAYGFDSDG
jgi:hypothetical protein